MNLVALSKAFLRHQVVLGRAQLTVKNRESHLGQFREHLQARGITQAGELTPEHALAFAEALAFEPGRFGSPRVERTRNSLLLTVKLFCRWLVDHDYLAVDAGAAVPYAKEPARLPRGVPSEDEVLRLLAAPVGPDAKSFRDRTILEALYATGVRVRELVGLDQGDVDLVHGFLLVRGKGGHDRMVPLGARTSGTLQTYLAGVRP